MYVHYLNPKGSSMKKINVRKTETLKTTSAEYGCEMCPRTCSGDDVSFLAMLLGLIGLS